MVRRARDRMRSPLGIRLDTPPPGARRFLPEGRDPTREGRDNAGVGGRRGGEAVAIAENGRGHAPLAGYRVASTARADEAARIISRTYCGHEVRILDAAPSVRFRFCEAPLARTAVGAMSFDADIHYDLGETESCFLIQLADRGAIEYVNGGERCVVTRAQGMVTSPTRPLRIRYGARSRGTIFKIGRETLENHLAALMGAAVTRPLIFDAPIPAAARFAPRYRRLLDYIVGELDAARGDAGGLAAPVPFVSTLEDMVMTALLTGQRHSYSACLEAPAPSAGLSCVERVEDYVRADPARPFAVADFAALSGVSARSLHRAFRRCRGYSPMAFVRAARLERARARLVRGEAGATVTNIAQDCGFDHLGRFGQTYAARYGEPPSRTLEKARRSRLAAARAGPARSRRGPSP